MLADFLQRKAKHLYISVMFQLCYYKLSPTHLSILSLVRSCLITSLWVMAINKLSSFWAMLNYYNIHGYTLL